MARQPRFDPNADYELIDLDGQFVPIQIAKAIALNPAQVKQRVIDLFSDLSDIYSKARVADIERLEIGVNPWDNISVFYGVVKYNNRFLQLIGNVGSSSLEQVIITGKLLEKSVFNQHREGLFPLGIENIPAVQEFTNLRKKKITYDPLELHSFIAREVPMLRLNREF